MTWKLGATEAGADVLVEIPEALGQRSVDVRKDRPIDYACELAENHLRRAWPEWLGLHSSLGRPSSS